MEDFVSCLFERLTTSIFNSCSFLYVDNIYIITFLKEERHPVHKPKDNFNKPLTFFHEPSRNFHEPSRNFYEASRNFHKVLTFVSFYLNKFGELDMRCHNVTSL